MVCYGHGVGLFHCWVLDGQSGIIVTHGGVGSVFPYIVEWLSARHSSGEGGGTLTITYHIVVHRHHRQSVHRHCGVQIHMTAIAIRYRHHIGGSRRHVRQGQRGHIFRSGVPCIMHVGNVFGTRYAHRSVASIANRLRCSYRSRENIGRNHHDYILVSPIVASVFHHHIHCDLLCLAGLVEHRVDRYALAYKRNVIAFEATTAVLGNGQNY